MDKPPVAVVAGVGEGLGFALARRFARAGFNVALAARSAERLARLTAEIQKAGGKAFAVPTDLREEREVIALFDASNPGTARCRPRYTTRAAISAPRSETRPPTCSRRSGGSGATRDSCSGAKRRGA